MRSSSHSGDTVNMRGEAVTGGPSNQVRRSPAPTQRERFLSEMERTLPWAKLRALVEPVYAASKNRRGHSLELDRMLRIHFLQHWFHLSDAAAHEALRDSAALHAFACVGLGPDRAPAEIEICGFRRLLEEYGLGAAIIEAADRQLRGMGLGISPGAIVDATLTSARSEAEPAWGMSELRQ